jgi:CDP-diacylglycerol---glycerol-3-phosphate 3-phosphatidyltransferase
MNLPNALTLARIFLVPLLVVVLLTKFEGHLVLGIAKGYVAAGIFGIASLTDWLDGYLARRRQQVTILGQLLDPIADKLLISAALVSLVQLDLAPAWMAAIIIGRELAVTGLRGIAQTRGLIMPASPLGKAKMATEVIAILLLMLGQELGPALIRLGQLSLWLVLAFALWSAVEYYQTFTAVLTGRAPASGPASAEEPVPPVVTPPSPVASTPKPSEPRASAAPVGRINGHAVADPAASRGYSRPAPRRS